MKHRVSFMLSLCCLMAAGLAVRGQAVGQFNSISRREIELLLADIAKTNPDRVKKLAEDPALKKQQIENLKQLLAFASEAQKVGIAGQPAYMQELENIRSEVIAVNYDREINKTKPALPPFEYIGSDRIANFWRTKANEAGFEKFLNAKLTLVKESNRELANNPVTPEARKQAREMYAKTHIYQTEYELKANNGTLSREFIDKTKLKIKLQQAQFLARLYADKNAEQTKVDDAEIAAYLAAHPEFSVEQKRAAAQAILDRAKNGEDFAALANKYSEDPGNMGPNDVLQGGLYSDVPKGRMVAPFEAGALALEAGQVAPHLVETDFGFHIIKLDRKGIGGGEFTYDVRHILISTGVRDPDNPSSRQVPVRDYIVSKLEAEKEKKLLDEIVAKNNIRVAEDFTVPSREAVPVAKKAVTRRRARKK